MNLEFIKNPIIPWILLLLAGVFIGLLLKDNTDKDIALELNEQLRKEALSEIAKKDSVISALEDTIAYHDTVLVRVTKSIDKLAQERQQISNKYENIYLNPDSTDWHKLDSLASVILYR